MSMQMDAYLKKQIGTLFVWVGALEGGLGGGSPSGVSTPKNIRVIQKQTSCSKYQILLGPVIRPSFKNEMYVYHVILVCF